MMDLSEPASWARPIEAIGPNRELVILVLAGLVFGLLLWRGSRRLGIPGIGSELRLLRRALRRELAANRELRKEYRAAREEQRQVVIWMAGVCEWLARVSDVEPPPPPPFARASEPAGPPLGERDGPPTKRAPAPPR